MADDITEGILLNNIPNNSSMVNYANVLELSKCMVVNVNYINTPQLNKTYKYVDTLVNNYNINFNKPYSEFDVKKDYYIKGQSYLDDEDTLKSNVNYVVLDNNFNKIDQTLSQDGSFKFNLTNIPVNIIAYDQDGKYIGKSIKNVNPVVSVDDYMDIIQVYMVDDYALYKLKYIGDTYTFNINGDATLTKVDDTTYKVTNIKKSFTLSLVNIVDDKVYIKDKKFKYFVSSWQLDKVQTFDTGYINNKYSIASGNPSISYDSTNKRLKISNGESQGFITYNEWGGYSEDVIFEMDVLFSADYVSGKHFGFWLGNEISSRRGYRLYNWNTNFGISSWVDGNESTQNNFGATNLVVGQTYTIKVKRQDNIWQAYINDVLLPNSYKNTVYNYILPGFFVYGAEIYVDELRVYTYKTIEQV